MHVRDTSWRVISSELAADVAQFETLFTELHENNSSPIALRFLAMAMLVSRAALYEE